jgi:hypothetical protein
MKDILNDIVSHTHKLGFLDTVKITGTEDKTLIDSMSKDRTVIMYGQTAEPQPDMIGVFGMPQLEKLSYLLNVKEYQEDAVINIETAERHGEKLPVGLHFENKDGDFKNDYRFMSTEVIDQTLKPVKFKGVKWDVEVSPSLAAIQRFNFQAGANTEHTSFLVKTDNGNLKFIFGDASTHGGNFVFASNVTGKLTKAWSWPVSNVLAILKAADVNNTVISFSSEGAMQITLDSGIATYKYIIPALA